jgi:hypothetical protein
VVAPDSGVSDSHASAGDAGAVPGITDPVASLPDLGIYLFPAGELEGVVLQIGGKRQSFDWIYTTPRQIMPVLNVDDYDQDGKDELAAVLNVGSGTGVSVSELHIVEWPQGSQEGEPDADAAPFIDHVFPPREYLAQLGEALVFRKSMKNGELYGQVTVGGQNHEVSLKHFQSDFGAVKIRDRTGFGNIADFRVEDDGRLTFGAAIASSSTGLRNRSISVPSRRTSVTRKVRSGWNTSGSRRKSDCLAANRIQGERRANPIR